ncbi:YolD-like family protein [Sporosarcina sp. G11-34]|uniref:YolD-like family protein n=1 Tax=Sporosarcina sp. G11-34 TaxID=2849605 RepID=UPI0022A9B777|nr:YolD-like family protein [Sporosarcina sp. G11-34]MCZ2258286.1 YolD-like family protein [Sporosarcina sp. G11-34]
MRAVPKPKVTKSYVAPPKLEEHDFVEIGEKIAESLEYGTEVEITIFFEKKHESFTGVIREADAQVGQLTLFTDAFNSMKINIMSIVGIK